MGKRSHGKFERRPHDAYQTPARAVLPLLPRLAGIRRFAEPCAGEGHLVQHLTEHGLVCVYAGDIQTGADALQRADFGAIDAIITNPPWTRELMHPLIVHFQAIAPTWLLFDADWAFTEQAEPFLAHCSHIVAAGRHRWIPGSKYQSKDNAAWYRFHAQHVDGPRFIGKLARRAG